MAVNDQGTIDIVSVRERENEVVLTISDHLDWTNSADHQQVLQSKLNTYLQFIESGDLMRQYPDSQARQVVLRVVGRYKPDLEGSRFLEKVRRFLADAGYQLRF